MDAQAALRCFEGLESPLALTGIAKAKLELSDADREQALERAVATKFPAAYYIKAMAISTGQIQSRQSARDLVELAASRGHLPSKVWLYNARYSSPLRNIWNFPAAAIDMIRFAWIYSSDPTDSRVVH